MSRLTVMTVSVLLLFASYASAGQSGNYAGIASGLTIIDQNNMTDQDGSKADLSYDFGIPVSLYLGRQLQSGLRFEAELFYKYYTTKDLEYSGQKHKIDSDAQLFGAMGNVYFNFFHGFDDAPFSPYLGAGVGAANVQMTAGSDDRFTYWDDDSDTVLAYQGVIGFNVPIRQNLLLDFSYRYLGTTDVTIDRTDTNINNHNVLLGIRYFW